MKNKAALVVFLLFMAFFTALNLGQPASVAAADSKWRARYWNNTDLKGSADVTRDEDAIDHDWGDGSPSTKINDGEFSARWTRTVYLPTGQYRFTGTMDDGMRAWVDDHLIIDSWYDSQEHSESADLYLSAGEYDIKVEYYEAKGQAVAKFSWANIGGLKPVPTDRWRGQYFNNMTLSNPPALVRDDEDINFDWGLGSPGTNIAIDRFSARWTKSANLTPGNYRFSIIADDGVRLWVNEKLLIDEWHDAQSETYTADSVLPGGTTPIRLEYYEDGGGALVKMTMTQVASSGGVQPTAVPPAQQLPQGQQGLIVNAQWLNVRSAPEAGDNVVGVAQGGQIVDLLGRNGGWVKVRLPNGLVGWVGSSYLQSAVPLTTLPVLYG